MGACATNVRVRYTQRVPSSSSFFLAPRRQHIAAAAYDRLGHESTASGASYAPVALSASWHRVILCRIDPDHAPDGLRKVIDDTLGWLRVVWIGMLLEGDEIVQRRLDIAHAAVQHELGQAHLAWTRGLDEGPRIVGRLVARREAYRKALACPAPEGVGMAFPQGGRATEDYPAALQAATQALDAMLATIDVMRTYRADDVGLAPLRTGLELVGLDAVGAWRLGEIEGARAARVIAAQVGVVDAHFRDRSAAARSDRCA